MFAPRHRQPVQLWKGIESVRTWPQLRAAMKKGFDLHLRYDDRGNYNYYLMRDGERSPSGFLQQNVTSHAIGRGELGYRTPAADGSFFFKLTTKAF